MIQSLLDDRAGRRSRPARAGLLALFGVVLALAGACGRQPSPIAGPQMTDSAPAPSPAITQGTTEATAETSAAAIVTTARPSPVVTPNFSPTEDRSSRATPGQPVTPLPSGISKTPSVDGAIEGATAVTDGSTVAAPIQPSVTAPEQTPVAAQGIPRVLGYSTGGWPIEAYEFGSGQVQLVMIGGIHGGYEWNSILLAYEMIDYFGANPQTVPEQVALTIIPTANPDGQVRTVGRTGRFAAEDITGGTISGRFNGNDVDLNRNWDCNWKPTGMWLQREISAGVAPFSEVETQILRDFLTETMVDGVVFWHSAMPGVFAGGCDTDSTSSEALADAYSVGSGYPFERAFLGYEVTGEATNWLAAQGIAAISVELTNHSDVDFEQNQGGVWAILDYLSQRSTRDGLR